MRKKTVAIVGDAFIEPDGIKYKLAYEAAKMLVDHGYRIQCGGLKGVMEAACAGAKASEKYHEGDTVAIVPGFNPFNANEYADIVIPTGLDLFRNVIVANAFAVVAVGGGAGTMSEICNAWALKRMLISFKNSGGWAAKIADTRLDERVRYENIPDDRVYGVTTAEEMIKLIDEKVDLYNGVHKGIPTDR